MARKKKGGVFVSYSRHDEQLVKPLAGLLGAAGDDAVFLDVSSIKPGDLWKQKIEDAVRDASVFIVCWCCECEHSTFIAYEIEMALKSGEKRLVPVLLCGSPLPSTLADRQWIDLKGQVVHVCNHAAEAPKPKSSAQQSQMPQASMYGQPIPEFPGYPAAASAPAPDFTKTMGSPPPPRAQGYAASPMPVGASAPMKAAPSSFWWKAGGSVAAVLVLGFVAYSGLSRHSPDTAVPTPASSNDAPAPAVESPREHEKVKAPGPQGEQSPRYEAMSPEVLPRSTSWPLLLAGAGIFVVILACVPLVRLVRRRRRAHRTEEIAAKAKAYFEGLKSPRPFG
jgi:TIR domain